MFGSISNWVSENKPAMPAMPTVSMPTVSMPTMPTVNIPGFMHKNKDSDAPATEETAEGAEQAKTDQSPVDKSEIGEVKSGEEVKLAEEGKPSDDTKSTDESKSVDGEAADDTAKTGGYNILDSSKEIGNNIGSMLFSFGSKTTNSVRKASSSLTDVIKKKTIIGDFSKENEKFVSEKKSQQIREDAAVAPWVGYNEEAKLKEQIIALSQDSRNFLRPPPTGVDFQFDFNTAYPVAMAILEEDPALSEMRFKLVPKQVKEENFWLNYFYRVSLIKQSCTLEELEKQESTGSKSNSNATAGTSKQDTLEFVSDDHENTDINDEEIKKELKQLNLDNAKKETEDDIDETEWDIKPEDMENISPEELEKEINSMLA